MKRYCERLKRYTPSPPSPSSGCSNIFPIVSVWIGATGRPGDLGAHFHAHEFTRLVKMNRDITLTVPGLDGIIEVASGQKIVYLVLVRKLAFLNFVHPRRGVQVAPVDVGLRFRSPVLKRVVPGKPERRQHADD